MAYVISDECVACGTCAGECPVEAISEGDGKYVIDAVPVQVSVLQKLSLKNNYYFKYNYFRAEKGAVHKTVYSSFFMLFSNCLLPSQLHYFFFLRFSCVAATIFLDC